MYIELCRFIRSTLTDDKECFHASTLSGLIYRQSVILSVMMAIDSLKKRVDLPHYLLAKANEIAHCTNFNGLLSNSKALAADCLETVTFIEKVAGGDLSDVYQIHGKVTWLKRENQASRLQQAAQLLSSCQTIINNDDPEIVSQSMVRHLSLCFHVFALGQLQFHDNQDAQGKLIRTEALGSFKNFISDNEIEYVEFFKNNRDNIRHHSCARIDDLARHITATIEIDRLMSSCEKFSAAIVRYNHFLEKQKQSQQMLLSAKLATIGEADLSLTVDHMTMSDLSAHSLKREQTNAHKKAQDNHVELDESSLSAESVLGESLLKKAKIKEGQKEISSSMKYYQAMEVEIKAVCDDKLWACQSEPFFVESSLEKSLQYIERIKSRCLKAQKKMQRGDYSPPPKMPKYDEYYLYLCYLLITAKFNMEEFLTVLAQCPVPLDKLPTTNPFHMPLAIAIAYGAPIEVLDYLMAHGHPYDFMVNHKSCQSIGRVSFVHLCLRIGMHDMGNERMMEQVQINTAHMIKQNPLTIRKEAESLLWTAIQTRADVSFIQFLIDQGYSLNHIITRKQLDVKVKFPIWLEVLNAAISINHPQIYRDSTILKFQAIADILYEQPSIDFTLLLQAGDNVNNVLHYLCETSRRIIMCDTAFAFKSRASGVFPASVLKRFLEYCPSIDVLINQRDAQGNTPLTLCCINGKEAMEGNDDDRYTYAQSVEKFKLLLKMPTLDLNVNVIVPDGEMDKKTCDALNAQYKKHNLPMSLCYNHGSGIGYLTGELLCTLLYQGNVDMLPALLDAYKTRGIDALALQLKPHLLHLLVESGRDLRYRMDVIKIFQYARALVSQYNAGTEEITRLNATLDKMRRIISGKPPTDILKQKFDAKIEETRHEITRLEACQAQLVAISVSDYITSQSDHPPTLDRHRSSVTAEPARRESSSCFIPF